MKPADVKSMTIEEMKSKEAELKKEIFSLKMRHTTGQLENPLKLRTLKRDIARVKTILAEKEREK